MSPATHVTSAQERVVWPHQGSCDSPDRQVTSRLARTPAAQAATLLVERIGGAAHPPRRIVLGTDLIVRESSLRHPDA
jgi:hypothetical protein